jgi:polar amino acid transport system substrate-binding protein
VFRAVAGRLQIREIDWIRLDFASLLPELQVGRVDAVVSGLYVTAERQRQAAFSRPTARIRTAMVHRANDIRLPSKAQQLDTALRGDTGLRWAVINGSFEEARLLAEGMTEDRLQRVQDVFAAFGALRDGSVDMFVISELTARHHGKALREHGLVYRTLEAEAAGLPAFAFRHSDQALRQAIDAELARFLGSAEHLDLVERFGLSHQELAP